MLEVVKALATSIDPDRDLRDGDSFYLRYDRTFTLAGAPIETAHVRWAEIRTAAKGRLALHRFRPAGTTQDGLWLASGVGTGTAELDMPLKSISVTSASARASIRSTSLGRAAMSRWARWVRRRLPPTACSRLRWRQRKHWRPARC